MRLNRTTLSIGATGLSVVTLGGVALAAGNGETPKTVEAKPIVIADVRTEHRFVHVRKHLPAPPRPASASGPASSNGGAAATSYASYGNANPAGSASTQASAPASVPAPVVRTHSSGGSWGGDDRSASEAESPDRHDDGDRADFDEHESDD